MKRRPATAAAKATIESAGMISKPGEDTTNVEDYLRLSVATTVLAREVRFSIEIKRVVCIGPSLRLWCTNLDSDLGRSDHWLYVDLTNWNVDVEAGIPKGFTGIFRDTDIHEIYWLPRL